MWPGKEKGEDIGYKLRYLWDSRRRASNSRVETEKRRRKRNNVQYMTNKSKESSSYNQLITKIFVSCKKINLISKI